MCRIPRTVKLMVAIVALLATTAVGVAATLAGYLPSKGYIRGGYEYSTALFGYMPIGGYERGGYEYSALFGSDLSESYEGGDYQFSALFGHVPFGGYDRGGYEY
jgi:hypothetical protein